MTNVVREKVRLEFIVAFPVEGKPLGRDVPDRAPVAEIWPDSVEFDPRVGVPDAEVPL